VLERAQRPEQLVDLDPALRVLHAQIRHRELDVRVIADHERRDDRLLDAVQVGRVERRAEEALHGQRPPRGMRRAALAAVLRDEGRAGKHGREATAARAL
jgi:hypothetical protein